MADNRRSSTRHTVSLDAVIVLERNASACTIKNLSLGGAMLAPGIELSTGERVQITFTVTSMREPITVGALVRWHDAQGTGLQFDGLRALDVWALNKYFEELGC